MITSDIPTGKGGGEKANYFIMIVHLLSSPQMRVRHPPPIVAGKYFSRRGAFSG
jgi:hypothetical protein